MPSYLGKGTIYVEETGAGKGLLTLGNCSELNLAFNENKQEQKDFEDAGGAVVNTVSVIDSVVASIVALDFKAENVALAFRGLVNAIPAGAIVSEIHTANTNAFIPTDTLLDQSIAIVVTDAGAVITYVAGVDYEVKNSGIVILEGGSIVDAAPIELSYTTALSHSIEGLKTSGKEYKVVFDGLNEANSGKPVKVTCHRVKFNPAQALSLIADTFGDLALSFDILKDVTKVGATESKFFNVLVNQDT